MIYRKSSYKRRLREWDLVKNVSSKKLEHISQTMNESALDQMQGCLDEEINLDGQSASWPFDMHNCHENAATLSALSCEQTAMQHCEYRDSKGWQSILSCPIPDADFDRSKNSPNASSAPPTLGRAIASLPRNEEFDVCNLSNLAFEPQAILSDSIDGTAQINTSTYNHDVYGSCSFDEQYELLACPFTKGDPARFSERNPVEVKYRRCSTVKLLSISRLK